MDLRLTIKALDYAKMSDEKRLKMEKEAETMIQLFIRNQEKEKKIMPAPKKPKSLLHASVGFDYNETDGRFAKAVEQIQVGETLVIEKPHCAMLLDTQKESHCHHCFKRYILIHLIPNINQMREFGNKLF